MRALIQLINTLLTFVPKQDQHDCWTPHACTYKVQLESFSTEEIDCFVFCSSFLPVSYFVFADVILYLHLQMCRRRLHAARLTERRQLGPVALTILLESRKVDQLFKASRSRLVLRGGLITLSLHRQRGGGAGELSSQLFLLHQSTPVQVTTLHLQRKSGRESTPCSDW